MTAHWTLTANASTLDPFTCVTLYQSSLKTCFSRVGVQLATTLVVCGRHAEYHKWSGGAAARQHHQAELAVGVLGGRR